MLDADGNINTGGKVEFFQLIYRAGGGINNVEETLVSTDFELFSGFFVHVNGAVNAEFFDAGRKRDGSRYFGAGAFGGFDDFGGGFVHGAMIKSAESDAYFLIFHNEEKVSSSGVRCGLKTSCSAAFTDDFFDNVVGNLLEMRGCH